MAFRGAVASAVVIAVSSAGQAATWPASIVGTWVATANQSQLQVDS
jgi:hypothetical protein